LEHEFGASQVILFGSLREDASWHWQSDLDLAVAGLASARIPEALERLWSFVPHWLHVDLVPLERVSPYRRFRRLVHHRYQTSLDADRVQELVTGIEPLFHQIEAATGQFKQWLEQHSLDQSRT
jgi:predicted nucleotidyltransferase